MPAVAQDLLVLYQYTFEGKSDCMSSRRKTKGEEEKANNWNLGLKNPPPKKIKIK